MKTTMTAAALVACVAFGGAAAPAQAQVLGVPAAIEGRVDVAFPMGDFADMAGNGVGVGVGAVVTVLPGFGIYGSYSQTRFGGGWTGDEPSDATDSGLAVGVSAALPGTMGVSPWVGGGLLFHRLEVGGTRDGVDEDLGFELGAGFAIPLSPQLRLSPAVNYRHYGASIPALGGLVSRDLNVQYLSLGVGLHLSF
jgi:hypothetical protein